MLPGAMVVAIVQLLGLNVNYIITRLQTKATVQNAKKEYRKGVMISDV